MSGNTVEATSAERDLLRRLVDGTPATVAYWDTEQRCRFANRAYLRWVEAPPEQIIGRHLSKLLGPLYRAYLPYIEGALRGEPQEFESEIPQPHGAGPRHGLMHYVPDTVDGIVRGFFTVVADISETKRAQLALQQSEERFRLTLDEAPIGMALVALDGHFMRVNRSLCEMVGYTAEELTGLTFQAITHPDDLDTDLALARQLRRGEIERYHLEKRYVRKDGTLVDVLLSGSALRGSDGAPIHYIAQVEDISERKAIEQEQRFLAEVGPIFAPSLDYEETLTRVAELSVREVADVCIVDIIEEDGDVRRLRVVSRDPSLRAACDQLTRIALDRRRRHLMSSALESKQSLLMQRPSAATIASFSQSEEHHRVLQSLDIGSLVVVPLLANERMLGAIALIGSTASRVYGPADVRLAEKLAQRAALAIENARLYRIAKQATQARDDVLGIVAHDLRNPLNNILMQTNLLRLGGAACATEKALEMISRAATRMNRLIQDLLDVTRMEAGRLPIHPTRVAPASILAEVVESQKSLATAAALELRIDVPRDLPEICVDRERLLQVFENLLGNAIKFTKPGGVVTAGAKARAFDVLFWVKDTGSGVAPEDLPHLFDRFWQARKAETLGAGLGLPIVKGLVEAHRGRIWVESTPAVGSCFYFTVPSAEPVEGSLGPCNRSELGPR